LRGDYIPEKVFYKNRLNALSNSIYDLISGSDNLIDPSVEFYKSDGKDRMYNYCKSLVSIAQNDYIKTQPKLLTKKEYISDDYINSFKIILQEVPYIEDSEIDDENMIILKKAIASSRPFFQRLSEREMFVLNSDYEKYIAEKTKRSTIFSLDTVSKRENNPNLINKYSNRNYEKYIDKSNSDREMIANAITNFVFLDNTLFKSLNIGITENTVKETYFEQIKDANCTYKTTIVGKDFNDKTVNNFIKKLIIPNNGTLMEVLDV